jgi:hypothetical protein
LYCYGALTRVCSVVSQNNGQEVRTDRTGVILDEIGLGELARQLASEVLAPVATATHPGWTTATNGLDSYYAFSIHVKEVTPAELEPGDRSAPPAQQWKAPDDERPADAPGLRGHIDVCEVSMNICIGDDFDGSAVYFGETEGQAFNLGASEDLVATGHRVAHAPGRAFINVCQHYHGVEPLRSGTRHAIVVRGMASAVRRAPAEIFHEQCTASSAKHEL